MRDAADRRADNRRLCPTNSKYNITAGKSNRGFTLVEIVAAAALSVLILGVAFQCWQLGVRSWLRQERQTDVQDNLRTALDLMAGELRLSGGMVATGTSELYFKDCSGAQVRYYVLPGGSLVREQGAAHPPVASHIKSLRLRYFAAGGNMPTTDPSAVGRVEITLTGGMAGLDDLTLSTSVQLRLKAD